MMGDWRDLAACHPDRRPAGMTRAEWTSLFFPGQGDVRSSRQALAVCAGCPVVSECRAEADPDGIWGETTARQRRRERAPKRFDRYSYQTMRLAVDLHRRGDSIASISRRIGADRRTIENWISTEELSHAC